VGLEKERVTQQEALLRRLQKEGINGGGKKMIFEMKA
jgi:hypothetical protein